MSIQLKTLIKVMIIISILALNHYEKHLNYGDRDYFENNADRRIAHKYDSTIPSALTSEKFQTDTVTLSPEAQRKSNEDKTNTEIDTLDRLIKEVQQQIKALNIEMRKARFKKDDNSQTKVRMLSAQQISLNAQLMELISKKLDGLKA